MTRSFAFDRCPTPSRSDRAATASLDGFSLPEILAAVSRFVASRSALAGFILGCLLSFEVGALDKQALFDEANRAYEQGQYILSASTYERLIKDGARSSAIHFNLGNALFRSGQIGKAIAHYRLAERLSPRDPEIRANLDFARRTAQGGEVPARVLWGSWSQRLTTNEWAVAASLCLWTLLLLLSAIRLRPSLGSPLKNWKRTATALLVLTGAGLWGSHKSTRPGTEAVVVVTTAAIRYGPLEESQAHFTLGDGAEVAVVDKKGDWSQIRDASQRTGWLKTEYLAFVDPP